jgi:hypothetical protein
LSILLSLSISIDIISRLVLFFIHFVNAPSPAEGSKILPLFAEEVANFIDKQRNETGINKELVAKRKTALEKPLPVLNASLMPSFPCTMPPVGKSGPLTTDMSSLIFISLLLI